MWLLAVVVLSKADSEETEDEDEIKMKCNRAYSLDIAFYICFYSDNGPGTFVNFTRLRSSGVAITGPLLLSEVASACRYKHVFKRRGVCRSK